MRGVALVVAGLGLMIQSVERGRRRCGDLNLCHQSDNPVRILNLINPFPLFPRFSYLCRWRRDDGKAENRYIVVVDVWNILEGSRSWFERFPWFNILVTQEQNVHRLELHLNIKKKL